MEKQARSSDVIQVQKQNDSLQQRLHELVQARQRERRDTLAIEKRLADEAKRRQEAEQASDKERRARRHEQEDAARQVQEAERVRQKVHDLEHDLRLVKHELKQREEELRKQRSENQVKENWGREKFADFAWRTILLKCGKSFPGNHRIAYRVYNSGATRPFP